MWNHLNPLLMEAVKEEVGSLRFVEKEQQPSKRGSMEMGDE